jgi:hypothetical protein
MICAFLALTLCGGMLATPIAVLASRSPQAQGRREVSERERIYDRDRKDYHYWDESEDRAYHRYWQGRHRACRDYSRLNAREQSHYWSWRHSHPDHDRGK